MISVVIPIRNEERFIARCLDSVLRQTGGLPEYEILCVDGASTDRTREVIAEYVRRDPRVRLIENPEKITPVAMNRGIRASRGEIVVRLDCHAEYPDDYIRNSLDVLERTGADNAGGYCGTVPASDTPVGRAIAAASSTRFGVGGSCFRIGVGEEREVDTVPFGCFRREVFDRVGMYDERLVRNQDNELNSRIRAAGGRIVISPTIHSTYFTRATFAGLRQQAFYGGLWNPYTVYLTGGGLQPRHFVPAFFVLSLAVLPLGGFAFHPLWWLFGAEMALYAALGALVSVRASRGARTSALLVWLSFLQLHISYGIGSLWGVVTAPVRFGLFSRRTSPGEAIPDRRY